MQAGASREAGGRERRARLARARLYLVCDSQPGGRGLAEVLPKAIAGGVEIVQLRDKHLGDGELVAAARKARKICRAAGVLLIVNDRPDLALEAGADGVHVGQDDTPVAEARRIVGGELLVGLSTHSPAEVDAAVAVGEGEARADYIGVGPVYATPTKPGRPAVGVELVRYAAAKATVPFFAIGGIDKGNIAAVLGAGAGRVCVVRAIAEAADPGGAAQELHSAIHGTVGSPL